MCIVPAIMKIRDGKRTSVIPGQRIRNVCVLVVHGIGQQRRGECAAALARSCFRSCIRDPRVDAVSPLVTGVKREAPAHSFLLSSPAYGNERIDFHELYWGPLACTEMKLGRLLLWTCSVVARFTWQTLRQRVCTKMRVDALQFIGSAAVAVALATLIYHYASGVCTVASLMGALLLCVYWSFAENYMADVPRYLCTSEYDRNIRVRRRVQRAGVAKLRRLLQGARRGDVVLCVAHSLGTVVALDVLQLTRAKVSDEEWDRMRALVTLGSPLHKCEVLGLGDEIFGCTVADCVAGKHWVNCYYWNDPVADELESCSRFARCVADVRLRGGWPMACHLAYWTDARVAEIVMQETMRDQTGFSALDVC